VIHEGSACNSQSVLRVLYNSAHSSRFALLLYSSSLLRREQLFKTNSNMKAQVFCTALAAFSLAVYVGFLFCFKIILTKPLSNGQRYQCAGTTLSGGYESTGAQTGRWTGRSCGGSVRGVLSGWGNTYCCTTTTTNQDAFKATCLSQTDPQAQDHPVFQVC
jgi:hypothetical protein